MSAAQAADLLDAARRVLGDRPLPLGGIGRIVVDDGGDQSSARAVVEACRRLNPTLPLDLVGERSPDQDADQPAVVLVVVDAGADTSAELLPTVRGHSAGVGRVALVCNDIDVHWDWPTALRRYRDTLDPDHLCAVFAVAAAHPDDPASGIAELVDWLSTAHGQPGSADRAALTGAAAALAAVAVDDGHRATLRRRRIEVIAERDRGRTDRLAGLRGGIAQTRGACTTETQSWIRDLSAEALTRIDQMSTQAQALALRAWLADALGDGAAARATELRARIERIRRVTLLGIDADVEFAMPSPAVPTVRPLPTGRSTGDEALVMVLGASTGLGVGRVSAAALADVGVLGRTSAGWLSTAATVAIGVLFAAWIIRTRRQAAVRTMLRGWVLDTCADARSRVDNWVAVTLTDVEPQVAGLVTRYYDRMAQQAAHEVAALDAELAALTEQARQAARAQALRRDIVGRLRGG